MKDQDVKLYALSTCIHCKDTKEFLDKCGVDYDCVDVDKLEGDERRQMIEEIKEIQPRVCLPDADDRLQSHHRIQKRRDKGGAESVMNVEQLYEFLKKTQEPKGYLFNKDKTRVFHLLQGLLENRERYGYMCCPCRLAAE